MAKEIGWEDMAAVSSRAGVEYELLIQFGKEEDLSGFNGRISEKPKFTEFISKSGDRGYVLSENLSLVQQLQKKYELIGRTIMIRTREPFVSSGFYWMEEGVY